MYFRDNGWVPNDPANEGYLKNPNGTMPFPKPADSTIGFYDGGEIALQTFPDPGAGFRIASFTTPIFDLRPDLRSMTGCNQDGYVIWKYSGSGKGGRLHIVIDGLNQFAGVTQNLEVKAREYLSPNRPQQMLQVTDDVDISDQFLRDAGGAGGGRPATYIGFQPTGEYPIRFWQVQLDFVWRSTLAANPQFRIFCAFY